MIPWTAILANKWLRWGALAAAVIALLLFARSHYIHVGQQQGAATQVQTTANENEQQRVKERAVTVQDLAEHQQQINELAQAIAQTNRSLVAIATQRQAIPAQMQGMTAEQVQQVINAALGKKDSAPYTLAEQQQIAGCFKDRDLCNQQVTQLTEKSDKVGQQFSEKSQQYTALSDYTTSLEHAYVELKNNTANPKRKAWCLWLCKRADRVELPDPQELKKPAVKTAKEQS